jgi:hypothetical protein
MSFNINQASPLTSDQIAAGDSVSMWSTLLGVNARATITVLLAYLQANLTFPAATGKQELTQQFAGPVATGFNIQVTDGSSSIWLVVTPVAGYAAGTITLPALANATNNQEVWVAFSQAVTTLTVAGNGANVRGQPTTLAANATFCMKFEDTTDTWVRFA